MILQNGYVITGGPGVGKTTLLNELAKSGFITVPEDARQIIRQQVEVGGEALPWKNKELYAQLMLDASLETYRSIVQKHLSDICFFDRGILDSVCYANMIAFRFSADVLHLIKNHAYNRKVFILPPWREIYETDNERKQNWEEAVFTFEKMRETYSGYGYEVIEVPKGNVVLRKEFVLENIEK